MERYSGRFFGGYVLPSRVRCSFLGDLSCFFIVSFGKIKVLRKWRIFTQCATYVDFPKNLGPLGALKEQERLVGIN